MEAIQDERKANYRAVATSRVGPVSTGPLFEATTTFLPIFTNFSDELGRPVGSHMAIVDRARAQWLQIV